MPRHPLPATPGAAPRAAAWPDGEAALDVLVVGGGINGCGIARELAGRGVRVLLAEQHDLASHTSSSSTKLIHGGLRYLEHHEFSLVRKALAERERLLRSAPHIMGPLRFVMPHDPGMRPGWMIRAGLFLYDHLAQREVLPGSEALDLRRHPAGAPLKPVFERGYAYSDGWVDDARLVVLCAIDAQQHGATVLSRCRCIAARRDRGGWTAELQADDGSRRSVRARALVNAAGPWAGSFLRHEAAMPMTRSLRLVKGSHIVVPSLFEHGHAYLFQNPDKRIIFAIPYEGRFTLIGTTDVEIDGEPDTARIDAAETRYLCDQASRYFRVPVLPERVVWSYSGVRPLLDDDADDAAAVTRDYRLELDLAPAAPGPAGGAGVGDARQPPSPDDRAPLLSVWGGKITTFRKLAEEAADRLLAPQGPLQPPQGRRWGGAWTAEARLPGGDLSAWIGPPQHPARDFERFEQQLQRRHAWLPAPMAHRLARCYGSRIDRVLAPGARELRSLGAEVAPGLHEAELLYLRREEHARSAEDVLWRRTKLGLHYGPAERERVTRWWAEHPLPAVTLQPATAGSAEAPWS